MTKWDGVRAYSCLRHAWSLELKHASISNKLVSCSALVREGHSVCEEQHVEFPLTNDPIGTPECCNQGTHTCVFKKICQMTLGEYDKVFTIMTEVGKLKSTLNVPGSAYSNQMLGHGWAFTSKLKPLIWLPIHVPAWDTDSHSMHYIDVSWFSYYSGLNQKAKWVVGWSTYACMEILEGNLHNISRFSIYACIFTWLATKNKCRLELFDIKFCLIALVKCLAFSFCSLLLKC